MAATITAPDALGERPAPMPIRRLVRAYLVEAGYETLNALRTPAFALPFLLIPVAVYLLFGVLMVDDAWGPDVPNYLFSGFSVVAAMMPAIFVGCVSLALERDGGLFDLKRALPMPPGATLVAKMLTSILVGAISLSLVTVAALLAGKITISVSQVLLIWGVMVIGTIPFFAIGFFIGSIASGSAAPAYGNLVFLPMMWLSGLFIPLPDFLEPWVVVWPAFHLNQLALGVAGVTGFSFFPPSMAAGVLAGVTVLFGGLAIRRLARVG
jgi:ABC-2 type transport system permease protein